MYLTTFPTQVSSLLHNNPQNDSRESNLFIFSCVVILYVVSATTL